jgi:MYXO-CTERM domain-containing protein
MSTLAPKFTRQVAFVLALLGLLPSAASAWTVTGWFQGVLANGDVTPLNPGTPYAFDELLGRPAQGHFTIEIDEAAAAAQPFDDFLALPGRMTVGLTVRDVDLSWSSGLGGDAIGRWQTDSTGRQLGFWTDYRPRFDGHILDFLSDDGSLRQGSTPADYRLDRSTVDDLSFYFASGRLSAWFNMEVTAFGFGALAAPVPEPPAALLLALGVVGVVAHQRRRAASASRRVAS